MTLELVSYVVASLLVVAMLGLALMSWLERREQEQQQTMVELKQRAWRSAQHEARERLSRRLHERDIA